MFASKHPLSTGELTGVSSSKAADEHHGQGDVAEQAVVFALMAAGKTVLKPISNGLRYDLVIDNLEGTFTRVQCKTGMLKRADGVLSFRAYNCDARRPQGVPYQGQVDAFGIYCPQNGASTSCPWQRWAGSRPR